MKMPSCAKKNCFYYARHYVLALIFLVILSLLIGAMTVMVVSDNQNLSNYHTFMKACIEKGQAFRSCLSSYY